MSEHQEINDVSPSSLAHIIGQRATIDRLLIGLLTGGHVLLEGVPGLAKTLAVRTLARGLSLSGHR